MRTTLLNIFDWSVKYFSSGDWQETVWPLKIISLIISVAFFVFWLYLVYKVTMIFKKPAGASDSYKTEIKTSRAQEAVNQDWQAILDKIEKNDEGSRKLAIIEADKLLDEALKNLGIGGIDMGERLRQIPPNLLSNPDEVWRVHKLRNRLVHEPSFQLNQSTVKRAIEIYQRALQDLGQFNRI